MCPCFSINKRVCFRSSKNWEWIIIMGHRTATWFSSTEKMEMVVSRMKSAKQCKWITTINMPKSRSTSIKLHATSAQSKRIWCYLRETARLDRKVSVVDKRQRQCLALTRLARLLTIVLEWEPTLNSPPIGLRCTIMVMVNRGTHSP